MHAAVAWLLLIAAPESACPALSSEGFRRVAPEIRRQALRWELLDPREVKYTLARHEDFASDLDMLRRRWHSLAGAPFLCDAQRLPERQVLTDWLAFNRAYRGHMELCEKTDPGNAREFMAVRWETDQLHTFWDAARDAQTGYYYVTVRREALKKMEDQIGPEAYLSGRWPPHVPIWRFQPIP